MNVKNSQLISKYVKISQGTEIPIYLFFGPALILPMNCDGSLQQNSSGRRRASGFSRADVPCTCPSPLQREEKGRGFCAGKHCQVRLAFSIGHFQ